MPFNGAGMFVRVRSWVADAAAGIKIRADYHDIEDDGFAAGISQCIARDGQSTITNNLPMNGKRLVALQDPVDPQDAVTKAYDDLKLPLTGGTITGQLVVTGNITARGYLIRAGASGAIGGSVFNFNYASGFMQAWIDNTNIGNVATTAYVETRAEAWAAQYAAPKVNRSGDTMTGALTFPYSFASSNVYYFGGGGGWLQWQGGGTYNLGGGGNIWHTGNLNPIQSGRWIDNGDTGVGYSPADNAGAWTDLGNVYSVHAVYMYKPANAPSYLHSLRFHYLQLLTPGGWFTVAN